MDLVPDLVEDENVLLYRNLHDCDPLFPEVVFEIETNNLVVLCLEPLVVHGEDAVDGAPFVGVHRLDPRVVVGVELVHLRRALAVVQVLEVRQPHQRRPACTHGGRGVEVKGERGVEEEIGVFRPTVLMRKNRKEQRRQRS